MSIPGPFAQIINLFHFTDTRNLPLIRQLGGLYALTVLKKIGHSVPAPGGNDWSQDADARSGMDRFVHLCFCSSHPMEYMAKQEGRIVESIFLKIDPSVLMQPGVMFTPGVSNKAGMIPLSIEEAKELIDFEVLYRRTDWKDPAIIERRKQAQKCEILVPDRIALEMIRNMPSG